jgi:hypothetical protein
MHRAKVLLIIFMISIMVIPVAAKKTKTADVKDDVLTDLKLGYTIDVPDNWKVKTFKEKPDEPAVLRVLMTQKNYQINTQARDLNGDFTIPELQIYARPAKMTAQEFLDKLKHDVEVRSSDDDIINQMNLVLAGEFVGSQPVKLAGEDAIQALFKRNWERHLQADPDDPRYRQYGGLLVQSIHDNHDVFIFVHDGYLYVIQAFVEYEFYTQLHEEVARIISSMKFPEGDSASAK